MRNQHLEPTAFIPLPLGAIRPEGWLAQQLRIQADGISGQLDTFWPDIQASQWFGGHSESWERAPYWLDGLIPLAYALDDPLLKAKVSRYVGYIIEHQHDDGWLGPRTMVAGSGQAAQQSYDLWAQLLATKMLMQYAEASDDPRAVAALERALRCIDKTIDTAPLFNWGQFRWFEALPAIYWLFERTEATWLLDLATKVRAQGFDWGAFFTSPTGWPAAAPTPHGRWNFMSHVVNNGMAPKAHALWWRISGDARDRDVVYTMLKLLDEHHGMVTGMFTGDECLAGKRPTQGTELCAVVEFAYSLEVLLSIMGDAAFGDRLEKLIFNALPATFSPDMWSHQYDQQVNQVECSVRGDREWNTNGPASNTFGVEPNYGCCTANLSQGWPKFAAHLWMRSNDGGLAAAAYAPSAAETTVQGVGVTARLVTDYPFRDTLHLTVTAAQPVRFPLWLRIPAWTDGATVQIAGEDSASAAAGWHRIERVWSATTELTLRFAMRPRLLPGQRGAVAIECGPLVYALKIGEAWKRINADHPYRELPHADWEIYPTTPWNYALHVSEATLSEDVRFIERPLGSLPFSPEGTPVVAEVQGRRLPGWQMEHGSAVDAPASPVTSQEDMETLTLIPYGCSNLRITEFPVLKR